MFPWNYNMQTCLENLLILSINEIYQAWFIQFIDIVSLQSSLWQVQLKFGWIRNKWSWLYLKFLKIMCSSTITRFLFWIRSYIFVRASLSDIAHNCELMQDKTYFLHNIHDYKMKPTSMLLHQIICLRFLYYIFCLSALQRKCRTLWLLDNQQICIRNEQKMNTHYLLPLHFTSSKK